MVGMERSVIKFVRRDKDRRRCIGVGVGGVDCRYGRLALVNFLSGLRCDRAGVAEELKIQVLERCAEHLPRGGKNK